MTALQEYQRLECSGLWRESPDAQRREVIVAFGDATLVISDARNNRALAHWSLPAALRTNPGQRPALFAPGREPGEELELEDETMIGAIGKVRTIIEARRPHPGRLRIVLLGSALATVLGFGLFWMPPALINHTAAALPFGKRQEIGLAALADLTRLSGPPCSVPEGQAALGKLRETLLGDRGQIYILPSALAFSAHLPGRIVLLGRGLIEDQATFEAAAGHVIAETLRIEQADPLIDLLNYAGLRASFGLLTTGNLPAAALTGYGEEVLTRPQSPVAQASLLARFGERGLASTPYALARDASGKSTAALIEADPFAKAPSAAPMISDSDWVAIQGICAG